MSSTSMALVTGVRGRRYRYLGSKQRLRPPGWVAQSSPALASPGSARVKPGAILEQEKAQPATRIAGDDRLPAGQSTRPRGRIEVKSSRRQTGFQRPHLQHFVPGCRNGPLAVRRRRHAGDCFGVPFQVPNRTPVFWSQTFSVLSLRTVRAVDAVGRRCHARRRQVNLGRTDNALHEQR